MSSIGNLGRQLEMSASIDVEGRARDLIEELFKSPPLNLDIDSAADYYDDGMTKRQREQLISIARRTLKGTTVTVHLPPRHET